MDGALPAFALKLPLALLVFLLIAYAGTVNRHIAGVLFTFPILNGVAIITSSDPITVADAIYPLVIFNCVLFALLISFPGSLPPVSGLSRGPRLLVRVVTWAIAWFAGAWWLTDFRNAIPGAGVLFGSSCVIAVLFMAAIRAAPSPTETHAIGQAAHAGFVQRQLEGFAAFWLNRTGAGRVVFFTLAYGCVFLASRVALDEKWVGMASALPLPGFFALAALIDDAEESHAPRAAFSSLLAIRDTLFLGPLLVIPFNWALSHLLVSAIPSSATALRYSLLLALWTIAALVVLLGVPLVTTRFNRNAT